MTSHRLSPVTSHFHFMFQDYSPHWFTLPQSLRVVVACGHVTARKNGFSDSAFEHRVRLSALVTVMAMQQQMALLLLQYFRCLCSSVCPGRLRPPVIATERKRTAVDDEDGRVMRSEVMRCCCCCCCCCCWHSGEMRSCIDIDQLHDSS